MMNDKELVAHYAAQQVTNAMCVGLNTGSTANYFIEELARRYHEDMACFYELANTVLCAVNGQVQERHARG
jgi:ribose 5-phosphate isomerase A